MSKAIGDEPLPDAASAQLYFPTVSRCYLLLVKNRVVQRWAVHNYTKRMEHLRNTVIWPFVTHNSRKQRHLHTSEHGQMLNIVELAVPSALESRPEVSHEDLCAFVEAHTPAIERRLVAERRKVLH